MNVFDHYYDRVENNKLSKEQLIEIVDQISRLNSFGSNKKSAFDLYLLMSQQSVADDELIRRLVEANVDGSVGYVNFTYRIMDNGSEQLFNDFWNNGVGRYKNFKAWKCKYASEKQLTEIYQEYFGSKKSPDVHGQWLADEKNDFFKHPNAPDKLLARVGNLRDDAALVQMVQSPTIDKKPKTFEYICDKFKTWTGFNTKVETMVIELLTNDSLDWMTVAKGIELPKQLGKVFGKKVDSDPLAIATFKDIVSKKIKEAFIHFCKRKESPENVKNYMYVVTGDEEFFPQSAKDVFLF